MIYLDTHVVVWLYDGAVDRLSDRARALIEQEDLLASPMVALELEYLFEVGKITAHAQTIVDYLQARIDLAMCPMPLNDVVTAALTESWTRDPFDRMITAQARRHGERLLTKDRAIHEHYHQAIW